VSCEATADHLGVVHETLTRFWQEVESPPGDEWRMLFELAVSEIAANIVEHARPQRMTLHLSLERRRVVAKFEDSGQGWSGPPDPGQIIDELAERGRGLHLAMKAVDDVVYEREANTNRWRLTKSL
jgi:serine/threonine-protein kinase RsbW